MDTARVLATCAAAVLLAGCSADPQSGAARPDSEATPTGEPTTGEVIELPPGGEFTTLSAGRYSARRIGSPLRYEVDVPDGWRVLDGTYLNAPTDGHGILFVADVPRDGTDLPVHPCRDHTLWRVGPTEADLARAIADQPVWRVSRPARVTVDGSRGFYLEIELPARVDPADCEGGAGSSCRPGATTRAARTTRT